MGQTGIDPLLVLGLPQRFPGILSLGTFCLELCIKRRNSALLCRVQQRPNLLKDTQSILRKLTLQRANLIYKRRIGGSSGEEGTI